MPPRLARVTRTCAYDRAGIGDSNGVVGLRDARAELDDLDTLLVRTGLHPPPVIGGHSYGGVLARAFAVERPSAVGGHGPRRQRRP